MWLCSCDVCVDARKRTTLAHAKGFCAWCGKLKDKRNGTKYCKATCRVSAFRERKKKRYTCIRVQPTLPFAVEPEAPPAETGLAPETSVN
jgi:hypothetical protein